jgi:hypothetical protein
MVLKNHPSVMLSLLLYSVWPGLTNILIHKLHSIRFAVIVEILKQNKFSLIHTQSSLRDFMAQFDCNSELDEHIVDEVNR